MQIVKQVCVIGTDGMERASLCYVKGQRSPFHCAHRLKLSCRETEQVLGLALDDESRLIDGHLFVTLAVFFCKSSCRLAASFSGPRYKSVSFCMPSTMSEL